MTTPLEEAQEMAKQAEEAGGARCHFGEAAFFLPGPLALVPGHIYSAAGRDEYNISKTCEYHFDAMFADPGVCDCGQACCDEVEG